MNKAYKKLQNKEHQLAIAFLEEKAKHLQDLMTFKLSEVNNISRIGYMSAGIIHDIRSPLTTIYLNLQYIQEQVQQQQNTNVKSSIKLALYGTKKIENLIDQFREDIITRDIAESFSVLKEIKDSIRLLQNKAKQEKVRIVTKGNKSARIYGNKSKFHQLILNLVINGIEAFKDNVGRDALVEIVITELAEMVEIRVKDNGSGIPQDKMDMLFEPFNTSKKRTGGMGLGLYICKQIIEKDFGGEIEVESMEGNGSEFILKIPLTSQKLTR